MSINEQRIREFAFQIWESEGKPSGQEERHWQMACKLAEAEAAAETETEAPGELQSAPAPKSEHLSTPQSVSLAEAEQPALLKKPRTPPRSATKSPKV